MSEKLDQFIDSLNEILSWELAGTIQYLHHATMINGPWREPLNNFFHEGSEEARDHAEAVANKIVSLGGVPTVEPAQIRLATGYEEMLEAALQLEIDALAAWQNAYELSDVANPGTQFWMEEYIAHEQEHVDELRLLTADISPSLGASAGKGSESAG